MKAAGFVLLQKSSFFILLALLFFIISTQQIIAQEQKENPNPPNSQSASVEENESIVVNTNLITFTVSVTDADGFAVTGLNKNDFNILDNKIPQEIHFFSDEDVPASISVVFDTSGSMSGNKIEQAKQALANFIKTSKEQDEFFLIDVGSKANLLLNGTRDSDAVLNKFTYAQPQGNTALYDAVKLGIEKVKRGSLSKKIVLVLSDGEDNSSRSSFKDLKKQLKESDAVVYAIGIGSYFPSLQKGLSGRDVLKELAANSGGKAYFPTKTDDLNDIFDQIAVDIRHLYSIGYYPSELVTDNKKHSVTVKINNPNATTRLIVRSRKEYTTGAIQ